MSITTRKVFTALAATVLTAATASAQAVNYSTTGQFSGLPGFCSDPVALTVVTCSVGGATGFDLTFTGANGINLGTPTSASIGSFLLTGPLAGSVVAPPGVTFTLIINQTTPGAPGTGAFVGAITGTVETSPITGDRSQLVWRPQQFVNIGPVNYEFIFDTTSPANGTGRNIAINAVTSLEARVTVPEPATVLLMGSGLAALGFFGARRKKN